MATSSAVRFIGPLTLKPPFTGVVHINLHINPGSSNVKRGIVKRVLDNRIVINIAAQARDGAANEATLSFLALVTQMPPSSFRLRHGHRSRDKTFEIPQVIAHDGPALAEKILNKFRASAKNSR